MKAAELRNKTADELKTLLTSTAKEQFNLRFQRAAGEMSNNARFRELRRTIARIKTLLTEKAGK